MSNLNDDSSCSDDDNMLEALKEATDSQFLKESLFHRENEIGNNLKDEQTEKPKSLRRNIEFVEQTDEFGVTQHFKNYVAKQLAKSLDECVQEIDHKDDSKPKKKKKKVDSSAGIKLLSDSKVNLNHLENDKAENIEHNKKRRKELASQNNSIECISHYQEAAVEPDWILSKTSIAAWANKQKGTVYKYKKSNDGTLTEITECKN